MKILYIFPAGFKSPIQFGGSISHVTGIINAFTKKKANIDLVMPNKNNINCNVNTIIYYTKMQMPIIRELLFSNNIIKLAKKNKYDVVYARDNGLVLLPFTKNINCILEYNSDFFWSKLHWSKNIFHKFLAILEYPVYRIIKLINFKKANLIVTVSKHNLNFIPKKYHSKVIVLPNGVDIEKFNLCKDTKLLTELKIRNNIIVTFVGTFGKWHGAEVLAKSIKDVITKNPKVKFLFIGEGLKYQEVKDIISKDKVEKNVLLLGKIDPNKIPNYLSICDILVNPTVPNPDGSEFFGSPTKLFEYMASGKAIISSKLGQMEDILEDKEDVLFCIPGDENDLTKKILILSKDVDLRQKLGLNARKKVEQNYTWDKNVERLLKVLK